MDDIKARRLPTGEQQNELPGLVHGAWSFEVASSR
jgi:hypothetical protein